ncbi:LAMI_0H03202g1_1 [Lachancea mirantina]|uniref:LAMI_0H03202g1_1 n=1 Tax=Lachancea mirantina TaxID=1230905 RepID=A0A1G4KE66_9SACH|nr:LAMI_0H03202g1_1 [Lachancea mirantina]
MSHSGAAVFKKVSGILAINEEVSPVEIVWRSTDGDKTHKIALDTIDKLQATPNTSEKMMLRLVGKSETTKKVKDNESNDVKPAPPSHVFSFNNRTVMDNIKETLQTIIARYKDEEIYEEKKRKESSMGPALSETAPLINTSTLDDSLSREKLLTNLKLQQSLLRENKKLMKVFQETVINSGLPPHEFWSTRVPLLRAFALTTSQRTGPYNVLSTIKPVASSDNKVNVSVSREKILTIFQTYPIVKKAYDDNVPKNFREQEFWARFFSSKLFRKLRGERIMQNDRGDMIIDRYLTLDQEFDRKDDELLLHPVKKLIDLEGNIQDDPQRRGNRPDFTMIPGIDENGSSDGVIDILKGMNRLSEKMIKSLENEYSRSHLSADDLDREERDELAYSDLEDDEVASYTELHLKRRIMIERKTNLAQNVDSNKANGKVNDEDVKKGIDTLVNGLMNHIELSKVTTDGNANSVANSKIVKAVKTNAKQVRNTNESVFIGGHSGTKVLDNSEEPKTPLPPDLLESCRALHGTCCEFVKHFYIHFQSGEPRQAGTVRKLYNYLIKCTEKISDLLSKVETEDGGKHDALVSTCDALLKPVLGSLHLAKQKYENALLEAGSPAVIDVR